MGLKMDPTSRISITTSQDVSEEADLREVYRNVVSSLNDVLPILVTKLELLDQLDLGSGQNNSLLFDIVNQIKSLDQLYLSGKWKVADKTALSERLEKTGEVEISNGIIITKRGGGRKQETPVERSRTDAMPRRNSFAATKYRDSMDLFHVSTLETMTDLKWIFYLNAYYLPYCGLIEGRSYLEGFFSSIIKELTFDERHQTRQAAIFRVLQETIYPLHIMVEFMVSLVECILEMITVIGIRVKTAGLNIDKKLDLPELRHPTWEHLVKCFQSPDKIYPAFRKRKLLPSEQRGDNSNNVNWTSRIADYNEALLDALDLYDLNCKTFAVTLCGLKIEVGDFRQIEVGVGLAQLQNAEDVVGKIMILNMELQGLIDFFRQGIYQDFYQSGYELLEMLGQLQEKYPTKYGGVPATPRSLRPGNGRKHSASNSATSSPRGSDTESPRIASPRMSNSRDASGDIPILPASSGLSLSNSGLLARWFGK
jgi:hypothetical protein